MMGWFTWKNFQALNYLTASGLHRNPVITHQECKHDQGYKLTGIGLQCIKIRKATNLVTLLNQCNLLVETSFPFQ